jgi:hypothetical protein
MSKINLGLRTILEKLMSHYRFTQQLPDLIHPEDYSNDPQGRRIRFQIKTTPQGIEILGDAMRPATLEKLLEELGAQEIEQMLCG